LSTATKGTTKRASAADMLMLAPQFEGWLDEAGVCLALTTYQRGRLMFVGRKPEGGVRAHERLIEQCQGLWCDGQGLWVSSLYNLIRFDNALAPGERTTTGADRLFAPRETRITGRLDVHDISVTEVDGRRAPVFVNTAYSCLATVSEHASFRPLWRPPFISQLVGEDRCHLNGLAMREGRPAYVTAVSRSDVADGWREKRRDGGVVVDVASGEIVLSGLSMPHSPRWHDGRLWLLNSGRGELGIVEPESGRFTPVAFCPGYARGLAFAGRHAVIGLSRPRHNQTFEGLELEERLKAKDAEARCGLVVVDTATGATVSWLRFNHTVEELYDVAVLDGVRQAEAIGFKGEAIERHITVE
jgi:uncharacterized protein (TIGR03032 family)